MATASELRAQAEALLAQAAEQEASDKKKLFEGVKKKLEDGGYGIHDLMDYFAPPKAIKAKKSLAGTKIPSKYRGPNGEEWSGRGRVPAWLDTLIGGDKEKLSAYLIDKV